MNEVELNYVAALIDSEGSISLLKTGQGPARRPVISIAMTDREPLDAVKQICGGFIRTVEVANRKTRYDWRLNGNPALDLLAEVSSHLKIDRRRKIAELLVAEYPRHNGRGRPMSSSSRAATTERLFRQMKDINNKRKGRIPSMASKDPTANDIAYLAGLLDGEGWIAAERRVGAVIEVWSTDPELIAWCASRFGGFTNTTKSTQRGNRRQTFSWRSGVRSAAMYAGVVAQLVQIPRQRERLSRWA